MGILDVFKHKAKDHTDQPSGGTATAVRSRAGTSVGGPNRKYTQHIDGAADKTAHRLPPANADDPTDQLPRFHPTTEIGNA